ncbi:MAG: hypothetical protein MRY83_18790 [Flavobacteriales bacterium]|nr:hypothetical protein [Flavobacteriales bacterium]
MKSIITFLLASATIIMISCSGSETYRGDWKATDGEGKKYDIHFEPKSFTITNANNETKSYSYSQNSINIENGVENYGISADNGLNYTITFPIRDDESKGAILDANGYIIYTISRDDYIEYNDISKLN